MELWFFGSFERHKPPAGRFCLDLKPKHTRGIKGSGGLATKPRTIGPLGWEARIARPKLAGSATVCILWLSGLDYKVDVGLNSTLSNSAPEI